MSLHACTTPTLINICVGCHTEQLETAATHLHSGAQTWIQLLQCCTHLHTRVPPNLSHHMLFRADMSAAENAQASFYFLITNLVLERQDAHLYTHTYMCSKFCCGIAG